MPHPALYRAKTRICLLLLRGVAPQIFTGLGTGKPHAKSDKNNPRPMPHFLSMLERNHLRSEFLFIASKRKPPATYWL